MSFEQFMKANKIKRENVKFPATTSLVDKDGNPLLWELQPISSKDNNRIREACTKEIPTAIKGQYRMKFDAGLYTNKLIAAAVVYPDLNNKELQDSYGVMTPEDLLLEMVDSTGELTALTQKVQEISGFTTLAEDVDTAKN